MAKMDDMIKIKIVKAPPQRKVVERREEFVPPQPRQTPPPREPRTPKEPRRVRRSPRYLLWFVAFLSVVFLFFSLSYTFSSANVSITPKTQAIEVNESFIASKDPTATLPFDLVVIDGEETEKIKTSEKKMLEVPSKGTIILYNSFSPAPQTLSIDTRLEGSNGKIYKTVERITIPGMKNGQPGSVEVGIYASGTGPEYDSGPLDFKVFGFKGTNKYEKIYARSKTPNTGGVKGEFYVVSAEQKAQAATNLKSKLEDKLYKKATDQIPDGFILFKDAVFLKINESQNAESYSKESSVPVTLSGTLYGFLFEEGKLTKKLAESVIEKYDGSPVSIYNLKDLSFVLANKETLSFADAKEISFTLSGDSKIVWKFDEEKFRRALVNKQKKDFNGVLSAYPNVASADLFLRPFWRMSFPKEPGDIVITVNYPK